MNVDQLIQWLIQHDNQLECIVHIEDKDEVGGKRELTFAELQIGEQDDV